MSELISACTLVLVMNAVTLPPPAWTVLAAYCATGRVPLLPLTLVGSAAATLGRLLFSWTVARFTGRLSAQERANAQALADAANRRLRWPWLFVIIYSFLPVPSDPVFVAIGLGALPKRSSTIAYFLARSVFNTLMVWVASPVVSNVGDLFAGRFGWSPVVVVLAAVGGYVLFVKLSWARWPGVGASPTSGQRSA
jgi:membrane protein YqaA with SNARE-associated domain